MRARGSGATLRFTLISSLVRLSSSNRQSTNSSFLTPLGPASSLAVSALVIYLSDYQVIIVQAVLTLVVVTVPLFLVY